MMNFIHKNLKKVVLLFVAACILFGSLNATRVFEPPWLTGANDLSIRPCGEILLKVLDRIIGNKLNAGDERFPIDYLPESYYPRSAQWNKELRTLARTTIEGLSLEDTRYLIENIDWMQGQIRSFCENRSTIGLPERRAALNVLAEALRPYRKRLQVYLGFLQEDPLGRLVFAFGSGEERFNEASRMLREDQINMWQILDNNELLGFDEETIQSLRFLVDERENFELCPICSDGKPKGEIAEINPCKHKVCGECYATMVSRPEPRCIVCDVQIIW